MNEPTRRKPGPKPGQPPRLPVIDRFLAKVEHVDDCWIWQAAKRSDGYGHFWLNGEMRAAHRISYELHVGAIPENMEIDHTCHKPLCVNPAHLRLATRKQNKENFSRPPSTNRSGVLGVSWNKQKGRWFAEVKHDRKHYFVGVFDNLKDATTAVDKKRRELFTHYQGLSSSLPVDPVPDGIACD